MSRSATGSRGPEVELEAAYTVVVTDKLAECRDFYTRGLGFEVVFEASWFVYMRASGESPYGVAFMSPDHPSRPPGPEAFNGEGVLLTFQVADAAAEFERVRENGLPIEHPLQDEPWGQRRFGLKDPSGAWVDVVEQIEPKPGFWD
jgi:catechol 2,3-dioxygenase-like lactoylglutathione lyase family enzyme